MPRTRLFITDLTLSIGDGVERLLSLTVAYDFTPGFAGSRVEPAYGATAEIEQVRLWNGGTELAPPPWLVNFVEFDEDLLDSLVAEAQEQDASDRAEADVRRAEDRAERLREEA